MPDFKKYADPAAKFLKDWEWKKMTEVGPKAPTAVPDYVQKTYGDFMQKQLNRAMKGELSPRDVLKAYGITQSSMGRQGRPHASATRTGMKIPKTDDLVRPEGAFAEWLGSPAGQQFLTHAERGEVHPGAMDDLREKFLPFGKQNQLVDQLTYGVENAPLWGRDINRVITGNVDDYRDWAEGIKGIAGAKTGFIGSLLGRGDLPTFDARQINLHTEAPPVGMASIMGRGKGQGAREAVDRLAARQTAMQMDLDPSLMPFYQHLGHHAVWDKVGDNATTHEDLVRAMQNYADGGEVRAFSGGGAKGRIIQAGLGALKDLINPPKNTVKAGSSQFWHSSPYRFDKFDISKIGSGEGNQSFGHGIYLAESPAVSGAGGKYFEKFKKHPAAKESGGPHTYKVEIPNQELEKMLDWDKTLGEQNPFVDTRLNFMKEELRNAGVLDDYLERKNADWHELTGGEFFRQIMNRAHMDDALPELTDLNPYRSNEATSKFLQNLGVPGVKYLDQLSRGAQDGTRNIVTFSDELPRIIERNGQPLDYLK